MRQRTKHTVRALLVATTIAGGLTVALQPSGSQDRSGDISEILGATPGPSASTSAGVARDRSRDAVRDATTAAAGCITDRLTEAGRSRGLAVQVTVADPTTVANDPDLALNWGFTVTNREVSEQERTDFQLVASAIEIDCQRQHFDPAAAALRAARRSDRAFMNDQATSMAKCLRDDQGVGLTVREIRDVVKALATGGRPTEPLATKVNRSTPLRAAITNCLLHSPDIASGAAR